MSKIYKITVYKLKNTKGKTMTCEDNNDDLSPFMKAQMDELSKLSSEEQRRILNEEYTEENIEKLREKLAEKDAKDSKDSIKQYKNKYYRK